MEQTIKHHLTDDILMGYAAGNLPEAFNLMVATHLSLCDACRAQAESYDALGGALFSQSDHENVALSSGSFAATMAMIADGTADLPPARRAAGSIFPSPLQDYVGGDLDCVKWRSIGMGVKQAILPTTRDASARLLFIPAGTAMPDHGHNGTEMTLVLQGAFQDEDEYFARGDVETADSDLHHTPVADIHADCICLAVTDAPLQFEGLIHKIAQRFARI
ncbi:MAG: ChrR family anti-sigma-E factor [Tateyamaria sp.]|uniref:ChrR family anti-sigma-E factor n=1 Tax=Tateyamaria sp. TaxID=1929288 RepID=UPI00329C1B0C